MGSEVLDELELLQHYYTKFSNDRIANAVVLNLLRSNFDSR